MSAASRRFRCLALLLLVCALAAPAAGTSASAGAHACCAGMSEPCPADEAPCTSLAATPCCAAAPVAAWPAAQQRESGKTTPAQALAPIPSIELPGASCAQTAPQPEAPTSLVRRSVVLRL